MTAVVATTNVQV